MHLKLIGNRLAVRPWTLIHPTRLVCFNRHLVNYDTAALASTAATTSAILRGYQLFGRCHVLAYAPWARSPRNSNLLETARAMDGELSEIASASKKSGSNGTLRNPWFVRRLDEATCACFVGESI